MEWKWPFCKGPDDYQCLHFGAGDTSQVVRAWSPNMVAPNRLAYLLAYFYPPFSKIDFRKPVVYELTTPHVHSSLFLLY